MENLVFITDKTAVPSAQSKLQHFDSVKEILTTHFGFHCRYDKRGVFDFFYHHDYRENTLGYDGGELWAKNPTDEFLRLMLEIAAAFEPAKVMGSNGSWYAAPDDIRLPEMPSEDDEEISEENVEKAWTGLKITLVLLALLVAAYAVWG